MTPELSQAAEAAARHWPYVIAAYALVIAATGAVVYWAYSSMRKAEMLSDEMRREP